MPAVTQQLDSSVQPKTTTTLEVKRDFVAARALNKYIQVTKEAEDELKKAESEDILALTITVDSPPTVRKVEIINDEMPTGFYNLAFAKK